MVSSSKKSSKIVKKKPSSTIKKPSSKKSGTTIVKKPSSKKSGTTIVKKPSSKNPSPDENTNVNSIGEKVLDFASKNRKSIIDGILLTSGIYNMYKAGPIFRSIGSYIIDNIKDHIPISKKLLGEVFSDTYSHISNLGSGTSGYVTLAINNKTGEKVVIKKIKINITSSAYILLYNEINILKYLKNKNCDKYTVCYINDIVYKDHIYIVQKYDENFKTLNLETLQIPYIKENINKIIFNLLKGLEFLHSDNICHNDIKPANILINITNGDIKYIDFGQSCLNTCKIVAGGTPGYMSPEMTKAYYNNTRLPLPLELGKKNDIWALGTVINEIRDILRFNKTDTIYLDILKLTTEMKKPYDVRPSIKDILRIIYKEKSSISISKPTKWFFGLF